MLLWLHSEACRYPHLALGILGGSILPASVPRYLCRPHPCHLLPSGYEVPRVSLVLRSNSLGMAHTEASILRISNLTGSTRPTGQTTKKAKSPRNPS